MCRGWKAVALMAACWCLYSPAQAQVGTYPSHLGAARMPEPIPCAPSSTPPPPQPNLIPGPIGPQAAPMGPPNDLSLPYDHTGAFQCETFVPDDHWFFHIGPMALQRQQLGAGDIAVYNAQAMGQNIGSVLPNPYIPPPAGTAQALGYNSLSPAMSLGIRGTVGYLWEDSAIEFTNFYIWQNDVQATANQFTGLDTLFYNPPIMDAGMNLFRRTNTVSATFGSALFSSELNYHKWSSAFRGLDIIIGLRYMNESEQLDITTHGNMPNLGNANIPQTNGPVNPGISSFMYQVLTRNNLVCPQIGAEYTLPIFRWLSVSGEGKGAWGVNWLNTDVSAMRGDGMGAFNTTRSDTNFAQIYQIAGFADICLLERLKLRLGVQATWLCGIATANDQVNYNLGGFQANQAFLANNPGIMSQPLTPANYQRINNAQNSIPHGNNSNNGSVLYWGPLIELQFLF